MRERSLCPGSRLAPSTAVWPGARPRGICQCCRREYAVVIPGVVRTHQGLPKRPDGGCPYRCPPDCDFDCYFPADCPANERPNQ